MSLTLVQNGSPTSTIVVAQHPTRAAAYAASELQEHLKLITGATVPIATDNQTITGTKVLVGESTYAHAAGYQQSSFDREEYCVDFEPTAMSDAIVLMGYDEQALYTSYSPTAWTTRTITLPGEFEQHSTCYAVFDFLEQYCGVEWCNPSPSGTAYTPTPTLTVSGTDALDQAYYYAMRDGVNRFGSISLSDYDSGTGTMWAIGTDEFSAFKAAAYPGENNGDITRDVQLFLLRMHTAGEKNKCSHSLEDFYGRFYATHPEWFPHPEQTGGGQLCYSNQDLINQIAQDAADYYDGLLAPQYWNPGLPNPFALVPMDLGDWCDCEECIAGDHHWTANISGFAANGAASDYFFNFANRVVTALHAIEGHEDDRIQVLAYTSYSELPTGVTLDSSIDVQYCFKAYSLPHETTVYNHEIAQLQAWQTESETSGRGLGLWIYPGLGTPSGGRFHEFNYKVFPGYHAHTIGGQFDLFSDDFTGGVYGCGWESEVDTYVLCKLLDDPSQDVDDLLDDYFADMYGPAADAMRNFYSLVEATYSNPANYPANYANGPMLGAFETEEVAWGWLGTATRMAQLQTYMDQAIAAAGSGNRYATNVNLFSIGTWQYMVEGKEEFLAKYIAPTASIVGTAYNLPSIGSSSSVTITANANDTNGAIRLVEFFDGNNLLGNDSSAPYAYTWNNPSLGSHTIKVRAVDDTYADAFSDSVTIQVTPSTTIGSWTFDEAYGATAVDTSPYANNGTLSSTAERVASRTGFGTALELNGADASVTVPAGASLNQLTGSFTADLWFKYDGSGTSGKDSWTLLAKNASSLTQSDPLNVFVRASDYHLCTRVGNGTTSYTIDSGLAVNDGSYHYAAVVYDSVAKIYELYLDNRSPVSQSVASNWTAVANTNALTIGYWQGYNNYFKGSVDQVQILTTALSQTDIQGRYANVPPTVSVTSPTNNSTYAVPTSISLSATTYSGSSSDTITKVAFYHGDTWICDGTLSGSNGSYTATGTWTGLTAAAGGVFPITARATDSKGATTISTTVGITVTGAPAIFTQPISQMVDLNETATFSTVVSGIGPLSYQWQKKPNGGSWDDISGATAASYTTPAAAYADDAAQYKVTVTSVYGNVTSDPATLRCPTPVGWWKLDETGTTTTASDASGNQRNGSLRNGPTWAPTGGVLNGGAIALDGLNDHITVPDSAALKYTGGEMTSSAWIYIDPSENDGGWIISKPWNNGAGYNYWLKLTANNYLSFELGVGQPGATGISTVDPLSTATWHHLAATVDSAHVMRLYVDGALKASATCLVTNWYPTDQNRSLTIGSQYPYGDGWEGNSLYSFKGKLDDVRIYDCAISSDLIAQKAESPVGYWKLDETGSTTTALDSSGNGRNGRLWNQPTPAWTTGKVANAIALDGLNDHITVPDTASLKYTGGEMTLSTWIYIDPSENDGGWIISKPWNNGAGYNYWLKLNGSKNVSFELGVGQPGSTGISTVDPLSTATWHHLAATVDSAHVMRLYVDGALKASATCLVTNWYPTDQNRSLTIGSQYPYGSGWDGNSSYSLKGKIDDVRIYAQSLGDEAIAEQAQRPAATISASTPTGNVAFTPTATVNVAVSNPRGMVERVDFYEDGVLLGTDASYPYYWTWNDAPLGTHVLTAVAIDSELGALASTSFSLTVCGRPMNQAVDVGQTATFTVGSPVGEPALSTYQWQKLVSGTWTSISGATGAYYTTTATVASDDGSQYRVIVSKTGGSTVTSPGATLYVNYGEEAWWKLDESSGVIVTDASGKGHAGTRTNGGTWGATAGIVNGTLTFDGVDSYVSVPAPAGSALKYTGAELALAAWVYVNATETDGAYLISKPWNGVSDAYNYQLGFNAGTSVTTGTVFFSVQGSSPTAAYSIASSSGISTGAWHYIAATVDSSKIMTLYIDGISVATGTHSINAWTPTDGNSPLVIGSKWTYSEGSYVSSTLSGKLDNVRVYTHALSAEAIAEQANCPTGYWKFNDGSDTTTADSSGNGYTGTFVNGPSWTTGEFDGGLTFDGTDSYVRVPSISALKYRGGGGFTIGTWVYINATETDGAYLISKPWNTSDGQFNYGLSINSSRNLIFSLQGTSTSYALTSPGIISTGVWHHVAATVGGSNTVKLYIDGILVNSGIHAISVWEPTDNSKPLVIGSKYPNSAGSYSSTTLDGRLDNVRVYQQTLTADEIETLAIDPPPMPASRRLRPTVAAASLSTVSIEPAIGKLPSYAILVGAAFQRSFIALANAMSSAWRMDSPVSAPADRVDAVLREEKYVPLSNDVVKPTNSGVDAAMATVGKERSMLLYEGDVVEGIVDLSTMRRDDLARVKVSNAVDAYFTARRL